MEKGKVDIKRSIIILKAVNKWTRDSLLKNQRPGKNYVVKRSIPKRFREVEGQLKEKARVVRLTNFNNVRTEIEIRGTNICLLVKEKNPTGTRANDWRMEEQIDLKVEAAKKPVEAVKMKDPGTSVLVTMNKEIQVPAEFEKLVKAKIKGIPDLKYTVVDKINLVIDCKEQLKASEVYTTLKAGIEDARIAKN